MALSIVVLLKKRLELLQVFWLLSLSSPVISLDLNLIHGLEETWINNAKN